MKGNTKAAWRGDFASPDEFLPMGRWQLTVAVQKKQDVAGAFFSTGIPSVWHDPCDLAGVYSFYPAEQLCGRCFRHPPR